MGEAHKGGQSDALSVTDQTNQLIGRGLFCETEYNSQTTQGRQGRQGRYVKGSRLVRGATFIDWETFDTGL